MDEVVIQVLPIRQMQKGPCSAEMLQEALLAGLAKDARVEQRVEHDSVVIDMECASLLSEGKFAELDALRQSIRD